MSKSKVSVTAAQASSKWQQNMKASVPYIQQGVDNVTDSPMEKAAAAADKYAQNVAAAVQSGRFQAGLRSVSLADWKTNTKAKVASRLSQGVDAALPKRQKFDSWMVNTLNGILPTISSMPDMTLEDSIARMTAMTRAMASSRYKG